MTAFDLVVLAVIGLSTTIALVRGLVRSLVSLVAWLIGLVLGLQWGPAVAALLPGNAIPPPAAQVIGFAAVFIAVVVAGALAGTLMAKLLHAVGLGIVDRLLGAVFGFGRGLLLVAIGVLLAGLTTLPRQDWWQNSLFADPLVRIVLSFSAELPAGWADRLDYSAAGKSPVPGRAVDPRSQRI
jgi:membrane protein required for colicin V production